MSNTNSQIPILFRYFMAASLMRQEFDQHLADPKDMALVGDDPMKFLVSKAGLKMCLWYGMLFVVIEGWQEANFSDPEVDRLLSSPNTESSQTLLQWNVPLSEGSVAARKAL